LYGQRLKKNGKRERGDLKEGTKSPARKSAAREIGSTYILRDDKGLKEGTRRENLHGGRST